MKLKKMFQRAAGSLLVLAMLIPNLSIPASAIDGYDKAVPSTTAKNGGVTITKSAEWDDPQHSNGNYDATVTISTKVPPSSETTTTGGKVDLALVFDTSGSMVSCTNQNHFDAWCTEATYLTKNYPRAFEYAIEKNFGTENIRGKKLPATSVDPTQMWPVHNKDGTMLKIHNEAVYLLRKYDYAVEYKPENFWIVSPTRRAGNPTFYAHFASRNPTSDTRVLVTDNRGKYVLSERTSKYGTPCVEGAVIPDYDRLAQASSQYGCTFPAVDMKEQAKQFITNLDTDKYRIVTVVFFSGYAFALKTEAIDTYGKSNILNYIDKQYSSLGFNTNYDSAWEFASKYMATSLANSDADERAVVFLTDGVCDMGEYGIKGGATDVNNKAAISKAKALAEKGVSLIAAYYGKVNGIDLDKLEPFSTLESGPFAFAEASELFQAIETSLSTITTNHYTTFNVYDTVSKYFTLNSVDSGTFNGSKFTSKTYNAGNSTVTMKLHVTLKPEYQDTNEFYPTNSECYVKYGKKRLPVSTPVLPVGAPPDEPSDGSGDATVSGSLWASEVKPVIVGTTTPQPYQSGEEIISSFYVGSSAKVIGPDGSCEIGFTGKTLSYNGRTDENGQKYESGCHPQTDETMNYEFVTTKMGTVKFEASIGRSVVSTQTQQVYLPYGQKSNPESGTLVYFKWKVPEGVMGNATCKVTVSAPSGITYERYQNTITDTNHRHVVSQGYWADDETWIPPVYSYDYVYGLKYKVNRTLTPTSGSASYSNFVNPKDYSETPDTKYEPAAPNTFNKNATGSGSSHKAASWKIVTGYTGAAKSAFNNDSFTRTTYSATLKTGASPTQLEADKAAKSDNSGYALLKPYKKQMIQDKSGSGTSLKYTTRSGYGFLIGVMTEVTGSSNIKADMVTPIQTVAVKFPEFNYSGNTGSYRTLERVASGTSSRTNLWKFEKNKWTDDKARCHFTPLWFPDGGYKVCVRSSGAWTPMGMLDKVDTNNNLGIDGSVYDDWHIERGVQEYKNGNPVIYDIYGNPFY